MRSSKIKLTFTPVSRARPILRLILNVKYAEVDVEAETIKVQPSSEKQLKALTLFIDNTDVQMISDGIGGFIVESEYYWITLSVANNNEVEQFNPLELKSK